MTRDIETVLASQFDQFEIRGRLHDVPPHEVYEVTVDGRRAVCKVARAPEADPLTEAAVIDYVDRTTDVPVPSVLDAGDGYFVATWIDGLPAADEVPEGEEIDGTYARALGAGLARLHEATAGSFDRPGRPRAGDDGRLRVDARDSMHAVARDLLDRYERYLADVGWAGPVREVRELFAARPDLLAGAGDPVVCHGNFLPNHVGFASGDAEEGGGGAEIAAVVDFEHALVAAGEYDYWRTVHPVFVAPGSETSLDARSAFREGYESVRELSHGFERRQEAYSLLNLASYFVALDLQNGGIGPEERPRAEAMADAVSELVASVRDRHTS